jgi:hypothetical protein
MRVIDTHVVSRPVLMAKVISLCKMFVILAISERLDKRTWTTAAAMIVSRDDAGDESSVVQANIRGDRLPSWLLEQRVSQI